MNSVIRHEFDDMEKCDICERYVLTCWEAYGTLFCNKCWEIRSKE